MNPPPAAGRRLAAVWFADIVGYTALSSRDEDAALQVVAVFQRIAEEVVSQHHGRVVKHIGDAALAEFASTDGAIRSALVFMERFVEDEVARRHGSTLRIGVNVGEVISSPDGDIYGDGVNLASRLQSEADPGQVIASEAVHAQIRQRPVFRAQPLGQRAVKGVAGQVTLYAVSFQDASAGPDSPVPTQPPSAASSPTRRASRVPRWAMGIAAVSVVALTVLVVRPGGMMSRGAASAARASYAVVEGGMEVGGAVTLAFRTPVDPGTATSANVRLLDERGDAVPAEVSVGEDEYTVVLRPRGRLAYGAAYSLVIGEALRSKEGQPLRSAPIAIRTQPVPSGTVPASASLSAPVGPDGRVVIHFSERVDRRSVGEGGVRLTDGAGRPVQASATLGGDDLSMTLQSASRLAVGSRYVVRFDSSLASVAGLAVAPDTLSFQVVAAPSPPPRVAQPAVAQGAPPQAATTEPAPPPAVSVTPGSGSGPATLNLTVPQTEALRYLKVVVNGDTLGPPPQTGVKLDEGRTHTISIVGVPDLSSYSLVVFRREVAAPAGQVLDISAPITAFGSIDVVSEPPGIVFVNGRQVGRTPLAGFPVTAGVIHRLEVRPTPADAPRFGPYRGEFRVAPLEWKSLGRVILPPPGGSR